MLFSPLVGFPVILDQRYSSPNSKLRMAYPKEIRESLTDYCNDGHSVREAQEKFGISKSTASLWLRTASGSRRKSSPHPVRYPEKTVRLAIGLAYGSNGFTLTMPRKTLSRSFQHPRR